MVLRRFDRFNGHWKMPLPTARDRLRLAGRRMWVVLVHVCGRRSTVVGTKNNHTGGRMLATRDGVAFRATASRLRRRSPVVVAHVVLSARIPISQKILRILMRKSGIRLGV